MNLHADELIHETKTTHRDFLSFADGKIKLPNYHTVNTVGLHLFYGFRFIPIYT